MRRQERAFDNGGLVQIFQTGEGEAKRPEVGLVSGSEDGEVEIEVLFEYHGVMPRKRLFVARSQGRRTGEWMLYRVGMGNDIELVAASAH
jgi:hypothetical protein